MRAVPVTFLTIFISMSVVACDDDGPCGGCPQGKVCCDDNQCRECCIDDDCLGGVCGEYVICNDDYECECAGGPPGEDCSRDAEACMEGLVCDPFTNTCVEECTSDAECQARTEIPFHGDLKCENGICDFDHCTKDTDCPGGRVCFDGDCVTIPACDELAECALLPESAVTQQGTTAPFAATAYLTSGIVAPGMTFDWSSSDPSVAAVDDAGLVTGGANTGSVTITATVTGCPSVSCTASVINYGPAMDTRVVVVDELDYTPIEGATVVVGAETPVTTDQLGIAVVAIAIDPANPADITVSHQEYQYVTLRNVEEIDVLVPLRKLYHLDFSTNPPTQIAHGRAVRLNFDRIRCESPNTTCDVCFGFAGISIPGSLINMSFDTIIGGMIKTTIELGGSKEEVPLPAGMTLCLNQTCFKEACYALGIPGDRVVWGLGGKMDLADLIDKLGPVISGNGEDIDIGQLIAGLVPLFANFYTAMAPNAEVTQIPYVPDINDIDDDPETPYVPDYDRLPVVDLDLKVKMDQMVTFQAPALPVGTFDGVILIGGVVVNGAGFVPLGLAAGVDSLDAEDTLDGIIDDPIELKVAEVAGRVPEDQVQRVIIALALNLSGLAGETSCVAGQIIHLDQFSGTHTLTPFLPPAEVAYDPQNRELTVTQLPTGVDYYQITLTGELDTIWNLLGQWAHGTYTLPAVPPEGDRSDKADFYTIDLIDGVSYQDLLEFNDANLTDLVELVRAFSYAEVP